jgi:hypothetical protein
MPPQAQLRHHHVPSNLLPALATLGTVSLTHARAEGKRILGRRAHCGCCVSAYVHLSRYVGSTLFFDDKPEQLHRALPPADRDAFSPRLIAACIVLHGRPRVELYPRT